jgi:hypothetical protein
MAEEEWVLLEKVEGPLQAELLKGLLEAQGINVWLNQQGASRAYAVSVGTLGLVEILVPSSQTGQAKQVLEAYYRGDYNDMQLQGPDPDSDPA